MYALALVTGATSGIGESLCRLLALEKIPILAVARNEERLNQLKDELKDQVEIQTLGIDLSRPEDRQKLIKVIHQKAPDLVINNAGLGLYGEALTYTTKEQENILQVNCNAVLELTLEAARTMISKNKEGTILNVSSAASFQIMPDLAVYAASKAFVTRFSQAFDYETQPYGVRILVACPGSVRTNFQNRAGGQLTNHAGEVMTPDYVAKEIWWQIQKERPVFIINWKYWLVTALSYLLPQSFVADQIRKDINQRIPPRTFVDIES